MVGASADSREELGMICAKCGELMNQTDKNTFTGRVIREYECRKCGHTDGEDDGVALWQILHDARKQGDIEDAAHAAANAGASQPKVSQPTLQPPASLWQHLISLFRMSK
jgi:Zn ribbon nucleic-acid-binding protein